MSSVRGLFASTTRQPATPSPELLAEQLKDQAYALGLSALKATHPTGPDRWRTVEVCHASIHSDAPDGWDVTIEEHGL